MHFTRNQIIIIGIIGAAVLFAVLLFTGIIPGLRIGDERIKGTINFWGVYDDRRAFEVVIADYQKLNPDVKINYLKLDPNTYETDLINALAAGRGPDIFMLHNNWLPKHYDKIAPLSQTSLSLTAFRNLYPTVVEQDFAPDEVIYALPLRIDTLALIYNKDFFDQKGMALPPKDWKEFQDSISKLRELDSAGKIKKAAAAIGGSNKSVNRATDLLNLLMLQAGSPMVADNFSRAYFGEQGLKALDFYVQFTNPASSYFTWNESLHYSLDNFSEGTTAMIFNYAYQIPAIMAKNPFLRIGVAAMPQPKESQQAVNYANYFGLTVSAISKNITAAWDFILYITTQPDKARIYSQSAGQPPALRSLINEYMNDPNLGIFAKQALTARSWPQIDNRLVESSFSKMIESVLSGRLTAEKAIKQAEDEITQLMKQKR